MQLLRIRALAFVALLFILSCVPCLAAVVSAGGGVGSGSIIPTYSATTPFFTPYATPTDIVVIGGSASRVIKIHSITITGDQTTGGVSNFYLNMLSTADSGGTSVALTKIPNDSTYPVATATALYYTAAPTPGTSIGTVSSTAVAVNGVGSVGALAEVELFTDQYNAQPIVLRGAAQQLVVNFAGAAVPSGMSISINIIWTEE